MVNNMKETIASVTEKTAGQEDKPTVMVVESMNDTFTNYGASSVAGDMVTQLGGTLLNPDASSAGKEDLVAADPDVIFVVYMPYTGDDPETVKQENLDKILKTKLFPVSVPYRTAGLCLSCSVKCTPVPPGPRTA